MRVFYADCYMRNRKYHRARNQQYGSEHNSAEKEYRRWRNRQPNGLCNTPAFSENYPAEAVKNQQSAVHCKINVQRATKPKIKVRIRYIEYHKRHTAVSADLFGYNKKPVVETVFVSGFVGYSANNIRY